ncbi:hypothetical protein [Cryobacterium psychrophilum]|uniref:Uncharacterized protein n=1 Tax=Cryobacterium psychrophilum TaxID=41988 RepID=A0A4Y8KU06_9MICO|nr:hypothetical protein [Cryobacterium psychrophilum]TDW28661.1 hypothetical protein EDD25_0288 [Cryobacterium psychrophilum]TFD82323.1 hypothetical protein E3T53_00125 [Cryobacterium psychrophilum]
MPLAHSRRNPTFHRENRLDSSTYNEDSDRREPQTKGGATVDEFWSNLLAGVVSGGVIATVLTLTTARWVAQIKSTVEDEARRITETRSLEWELLRDVLGPVTVHQQRTKMAFQRWKSRNILLETLIIADSNGRVRAILLDKFYLLTPELRGPAVDLIEHYDLWFEAYERERKSQKPEADQSAFTFVGPAGYPFPRAAEDVFTRARDETWARLVIRPEPPGATGRTGSARRSV